jgi:toxin FitB
MIELARTGEFRRMILLDTNVISEIHTSNPKPGVLAWFESVADQSLYLSAITEAELWSGVVAMADGKAKATKAAVIAELLQEDFADRRLPFDSRAARVSGYIKL